MTVTAGKGVSSTWGKITNEEIERINGRVGSWRPQRPLWRDGTRDAFRVTARSAGCINPLFQDEEYGAKTRWGGLIGFPGFFFTCGRLEGFGAGSPGFPGVHGTMAGCIIRWHRPFKIGDEYASKEAVWEQTMHRSDFAGRMLDQIARIVMQDAKTSEIVVDEYQMAKRWERTAAESRKEQGVGPYSGWKRWVFNDEELQILWDTMDNIQIRGDNPRYWEDVSVGENLPTLVTMPYTAREIVAWYLGYGAPFVLSNQVLYNYFRRHPGLNVKDRATNTPDVPERTHFEAEFAKQTGAPDMFDVTMPRMTWAMTMLTNWMGDDAFLRELSCSARRFNAYGDVTWINGRIAERYRQNGMNLVKIDVVWDNQRYRHAWGHALVALPSREHGPVVLPSCPPDPEQQPFQRLSDYDRSIMYSKEPDLPYGCTFKRRPDDV